MAGRQGRASSRGGAHARVPDAARRRHHSVRNVFLVLLFLLLCAGGAVGVVGYRFYQQAMLVKDHEMRAVQLLQSVKDMSSLQSADALDRLVTQVQAETSTARQISHGTLWRYAASVPQYGQDIQTVQGMTDVMDAVATDSMPRLATVMKGVASASLSNGNGQVNLQPIVDAQGGFNDTYQLLMQQYDQLKSLPQPSVSLVKDVYERSVDQFGQLADAIRQTNESLQMLPQFLGANGSRTYVIVAQTTSESRSSGGLVGSLGTITANNGGVAVGDFHPNVLFEPLYYGPTSEERSVFDGPLVFNFDIRDTTAMPDFSKVAQRVRKIWNYSRYAGNVDGVMMIDPVFIQEMVRISGKTITLDNGVVLNGTNTAEYLLNTIYKDVPIAKQDAYFEFVAKTTMNYMLTDMKISTMMKMSQAMGSLAQQRHLYMYTFHDDEAKNFQGAGFAKESPSSEENPEVGVYLNQQNASKMDWYIKRHTVITRTGTNADGSQNYHVSFTMTNTVSKEDAENLTWYIVGGGNGGGIAGAGISIEKMLFYAPAGGSLTNLRASGTGTSTDHQAKTFNGKSLQTAVATLSSGETLTYDFDVTTSPKATSQLSLDQTPMGWLDPSVEYKN